MVGRTLDWKDELGRWLKPFLDRLGHKARRRMCPLYVSGLIGPGDRKSIQPMAERLALGEYDQLHHFIASGIWDASPMETELLVQADRLVGGRDAVLVIPPDIVEAVAQEALDTYHYEEFAEAEVARGRSLKGLFPAASEEAKRDYEEWKKKKG